MEVTNRTIQFVLTSGKVREVYGYLTEYERDLLADPNFYKPHRSYIVNLHQVTGLDKNGLATTTGKTIPVARDIYSRTKAIYMKHLLSPS